MTDAEIIAAAKEIKYLFGLCSVKPPRPVNEILRDTDRMNLLREKLMD